MYEMKSISLIYIKLATVMKIKQGISVLQKKVHFANRISCKNVKHSMPLYIHPRFNVHCLKQLFDNTCYLLSQLYYRLVLQTGLLLLKVKLTSVLTIIVLHVQLI